MYIVIDCVLFNVSLENSYQNHISRPRIKFEMIGLDYVLMNNVSQSRPNQSCSLNVTALDKEGIKHV